MREGTGKKLGEQGLEEKLWACLRKQGFRRQLAESQISSLAQVRQMVVDEVKKADAHHRKSEKSPGLI